jgi:hypothetical protein
VTTTVKIPRNGSRTVDPAHVVDGGVNRVRIMRLVVKHHGSYMGGDLFTETELFLDGTQRTRELMGHDSSVSRPKEVVMEPVATAQAAIEAARTKNVVDFGRLNKACVALVHLCDALGDDPTAAEQEVVLRSYQGIIAWRAELDRSIANLDGAIDVAAAKVRGVL